MTKPKRAKWTTVSLGRLREQLDQELIDEADPLEPDEIPGAIMVDANDDILDGFHRAAGVAAARRGDAIRVPVVRVCDDDLVTKIAEPGPEQAEAIEEALDSAG